MTINEHGNSFDDPTIPEVATVTVKEAVDGTKQRRTRRTRNRVSDGAPAPVNHVKVNAEVWAMAKSIQRPGQHLVIVSSEEVRVVNKR